MCGAEGWARFFLCDWSTLVFGVGLSLGTGVFTLVVRREFLCVCMGGCTFVICGLCTVLGGSVGCCTLAIGGSGAGCMLTAGSWGCATGCLVLDLQLCSAGDELSWGSIIWNISANLWSASICFWPTWLNGAAGVGFCRAWIRSKAVCVAASFEAVLGIVHVCGKNSTVLEMRSWSNIPPINPMKTKRGARGVALKSNALLSWASADNCGFNCKGQRRLRVKSACGRSRTHRFMGNVGSTVAKPTRKWDLK
eukprot:7246841-Ditylum_brightwellii.AAC.1